MEIDDKAHVAALVTLVRHNIPTDTQELLVSGNPARDVAPGALMAALSAALATLPVPAGAEAVASQIGDAVLAWMVKYDLLDADNEYGVSDVMAVMDDLAPVSQPAAEPYAWLCNGKGDGWQENDKITRDPELVADYLKRPHVWTIEPLYRAAPPAAEAVVKPLEWKTAAPNCEEAESSIGEYSIERDPDEQMTVFPWSTWGPDDMVGHFDTLEAAKAAAQADYDARIRSALVAPASLPDGWVDEAVSVVKELQFALVCNDLGIRDRADQSARLLPAAPANAKGGE